MVRVRYSLDDNLKVRLCGARYLERADIDQTFDDSLLNLQIPDIDMAHLGGRTAEKAFLQNAPFICDSQDITGDGDPSKQDDQASPSQCANDDHLYRREERDDSGALT